MNASFSHTSIIRAEHISKTVRSGENILTILADVNLQINHGETVAITGPSGAGKSTLLGLLAGLDTPSTGSIYFKHNNLTQMDEDDRAQMRIGQVAFIFQNFQLLPSLNALENVMLPLELSAATEVKQSAKEWLAAVGLANRLYHYPKQLSGGEQQRVAIARAFAIEPILLFADEPTGNLDEATGQKIIELLFDLNTQQGTTLVIITHDNHLAARCQRKIQISGGVLV